MNNSNANTKIFSVMQDAVLLFRKNFTIFILIAALGHSFFFLKVILSHVFLLSHSFILSVLTFLGIFIYEGAFIILVFMVCDLKNDAKLGFKEYLARTRKVYWRVIGTEILVFLIFIFGLLLFVIPGIYWGILFSFAALAAILETKAKGDPLGVSKLLVKGSFFKVFLFQSVLLFFYAGILLISSGLNRLHESLGSVSHQILDLFYFSFSGIAQTIFYLRLREYRKSHPLLKQTEVKSKRGWLGCLAILGLIPAIIGLICFWLVMVFQFFQTEKGTQLKEYIQRTYSARVEFPGGAYLERPAGWFVFRRQVRPLSYQLDNVNKDRKIRKLILSSIPLNDLGISNNLVALDDPALTQNFYKKLKETNPIFQEFVDSFEVQPPVSIRLRNRNWLEFTLKSIKGSSPSIRETLWFHIYTIFEDYLLVASYSYSYRQSEEKEAAAKEELEIKKIIESISFIIGVNL